MKKGNLVFNCVLILPLFIIPIIWAGKNIDIHRNRESAISMQSVSNQLPSDGLRPSGFAILDFKEFEQLVKEEFSDLLVDEGGVSLEDFYHQTLKTYAVSYPLDGEWFRSFLNSYRIRVKEQGYPESEDQLHEIFEAMDSFLLTDNSIYNGSLKLEDLQRLTWNSVPDYADPQSGSRYDQFLFNSLSGFTELAPITHITKGSGISDSSGNALLTSPYHAVVFKPAEKASGLLQPLRVNKGKEEQSAGRIIPAFFNQCTIVTARDEKELRQILVTTYKTFGYHLTKELIKIVPSETDPLSIDSIEYRGDLLDETLTVEVRAADEVSYNGEITEVISNRVENVSIVDDKHRLIIPGTLPNYQGLMLPVGVLKNAHKTTLSFGSVRVKLDIDDVTTSIDVHKAVMDVSGIKDKIIYEGQPLPNGNYFIAENEIIEEIARQIIDSAKSAEVRIARMREFIHTALHYIPDNGVEVPRFFMESLLMRGGDCEDFSIALANMLLYMDEVDFGFLFYSNHLNLAITWPGIEKAKGVLADNPLRINGRNFYVLEATNPEIPIGADLELRPQFVLLYDRHSNAGGKKIETLQNNNQQHN